MSSLKINFGYLAPNRHSLLDQLPAIIQRSADGVNRQAYC